MSLIKEIKNNIRDVVDFPKKGIVFKDITPILKNAKLCAEVINELSKSLDSKVTHITGIESRGFLFGFPLSIQNNISFVLIRKKLISEQVTRKCSTPKKIKLVLSKK